MSFSVTSPSKHRRVLLLNKLSFGDQEDDPAVFQISTSPSSATMSSGKRSSVDAGLAPYSPRFSPPTSHHHLPAEVHWSRREDPSHNQRCAGTLHTGTACFPGMPRKHTTLTNACPQGTASTTLHSPMLPQSPSICRTPRAPTSLPRSPSRLRPCCRTPSRLPTLPSPQRLPSSRPPWNATPCFVPPGATCGAWTGSKASIQGDQLHDARRGAENAVHVPEMRHGGLVKGRVGARRQARALGAAG